jgi:hypothetical protein
LGWTPGSDLSRRDDSSHLQVLQQLDVQVSLGRPSGPGHVPQARGGQVESRLAVRERAKHAGAPPDLTQDRFKRVVGPDAPPMLLWEAVIAPRPPESGFRKLGGFSQTKGAQLRDHLRRRRGGTRKVFAGVDRLVVYLGSNPATRVDGRGPRSSPETPHVIVADNFRGQRASQPIIGTAPR